MWKTALWILLVAPLAFAARCQNWRETFIRGGIYYLDGDCYARMTRARMVSEHPGTIVHFHAFENFPEGVRSHTTAPLDYGIAALAGMLRVTVPVWGTISFAAPFIAQPLDLAGALVSPLLGLLTGTYLAWWSSRALTWQEGEKWPRLVLATPLFFALSPALVHADLLGRPDHQSAAVFLLAIALSAELTLLQRPSRAWCLAAGVAWGLALWISLFEPLILLILTAALVAAFAWPTLRRRERLWELLPLVGIVALMLLVEGSPIPHLEPAVKEYFTRWGNTVGEMHALPLGSPLLFRWLGYLIIPAPILLFLKARRGDRRAWVLLILLLAMFAATWSHIRWSYFLALVFALALPWLLAPFQRRWVAWLAFTFSLFPLVQEWDGVLFPDEDKLVETQRERLLLRDLASHLPKDGVHPFLAPWWLSPAIAYWSGQPGVTGSAHEGLAGIVDSARFFLATKPEPAAAILDRRRVAFVIVDEPDRLVKTSAPLLGLDDPEHTLCKTLYFTPHSGPAFLVQRYANRYYKLFAVDRSQIIL